MNFKSIRTPLILMICIITLLPVAILWGVIFFQLNEMEKTATEESLKLAYADLDHSLQGVYSMVQAQQEILEQSLASFLNVAKDNLDKAGGITISRETVRWQAVNQFTGSRETVELPGMYFNGQWLGQIFDRNTETPYIDNINKLTGTAVTIFQKMDNDKGMIRIATSIIDADGKRAIGTYIPSKMPDGSSSEIIDKINRGERYMGRAFVVNAWYITAYEPIRSDNGEITGMLFVGLPEESAGTVREHITKTLIGDTGYIYVLDSKGNYIVSQNGERDGENIWEAKDASGRFFIQEIVRKALLLKPGEITEEMYPWQNPGDPAARDKIARIGYFAPWDWIIGAGSYIEEFTASGIIIEEIALKSHLIIAVVCIISLVLAVIMAMMFGSSFTKPVIVSSMIMEKVSLGNIMLESSHSYSDKKDEIGKLLLSTKKMTEKLSEIVTLVKEASGNVASGSQQLSNLAQTLSQGSTEQAASVEDVSSSMEEMTANIIQNADNALATEKIAKQSAESAKEGGEAVSETVTAMNHITDRVTIIDEIARQTNLLALNAAIEAARAGEHGKGFAVVAHEIRKLAEKSQKAASEIIDLSNNSKSIAEKAGKLLNDMIPEIGKTAELVQDIAGASAEQRTGAERINKAIYQLNQVVQQNASSSEELAATAEELNGQAVQLEDTISFFNIG